MIYNFGDSISDTGNLCTGGCPSWLTMGQPPYGTSYFGRPTGRCSDGRLVVEAVVVRPRGYLQANRQGGRLRQTGSTRKAAAAPPGIPRLHVRVRVAALELIETAAPPRIHLLPVPGWSARAGQARRRAQLPGSSSSMSGTERSSW